VPKQLTVHNATITTASVEVKTLTISGKQVTLAVFKQLREEPLIGEDGAFLGEPWGMVNWHPDKTCEGGAHLHVVWQRGADLLRACVPAPWAAYWPHPAAGLFVEALIAEGLTYGPRHDHGVRINVGLRPNDPCEVAVEWKGVTFTGTMRPEFRKLYMAEVSRTDVAAILTRELGAGWSSERIAERLPAADYQKSWRLLNELPQLFIAV
jgi:hypothetical protein